MAGTVQRKNVPVRRNKIRKKVENIKEKVKKRESSFNNGENQLSRYRGGKKHVE